MIENYYMDALSKDYLSEDYKSTMEFGLNNFRYSIYVAENSNIGNTVFTLPYNPNSLANMVDNAVRAQVYQRNSCHCVRTACNSTGVPLTPTIRHYDHHWGSLAAASAASMSAHIGIGAVSLFSTPITFPYPPTF